MAVLTSPRASSCEAGGGSDNANAKGKKKAKKAKKAKKKAKKAKRKGKKSKKSKVARRLLWEV